MLGNRKRHGTGPCIIETENMNKINVFIARAEPAIIVRCMENSGITKFAPPHLCGRCGEIRAQTIIAEFVLRCLHARHTHSNMFKNLTRERAAELGLLRPLPADTIKREQSKSMLCMWTG